MQNHWNRRRFLRQAALLPPALSLPFLDIARGQDNPPGPNHSLNVAVIGVANRGRANLDGVAAEAVVRIVGLCDVDRNYLEAAGKRFPKAETFRDWRKMLDLLGDRIDAVVVSTPDHSHAGPAAAAMRLGKHCYCEKPLTHNVFEARVLTRLAEEKGLATQMGTQIHAGANYRRVVELVRSGAVGPVEEVHVWHPGSLGGQNRPTETRPVPDHLDWDLWLGPAPERPYHPTYAPGSWRSWWDFANGTLGDFGCHYMDLPYWALELGHVSEVEAEGPPTHPETTAPQLSVRYRFPSRGNLPPVTMTWTNGRARPEVLEPLGLDSWSAGVLFVGSRGMLAADYTKHRLLPAEKFRDFEPPEPTIPDSIGHHAEWVAACATGSPTTCRFGYSGVLSETVLLGNVAYRAGAKLRWDAERMVAVGCPEAERFLKREYRPPWTL